MDGVFDSHFEMVVPDSVVESIPLYLKILIYSQVLNTEPYYTQITSVMAFFFYNALIILYLKYSKEDTKLDNLENPPKPEKYEPVLITGGDILEEDLINGQEDEFEDLQDRLVYFRDVYSFLNTDNNHFWDSSEAIYLDNYWSTDMNMHHFPKNLIYLEYLIEIILYEPINILYTLSIIRMIIIVVVYLIKKNDKNRNSNTCIR